MLASSWRWKRPPPVEWVVAEEARAAKIKQSQAKAIGKRGKALGRFDHA